MTEQLLNYLEGILPSVIAFLMDVIWVVLIIIVGLKLISMLVKFLDGVMDKAKVEQGLASFLCSLVKYALYFILIMVVLSQFGVTTSSVVAVLGSAGLTLGLALQGSLSNFAGGVLILLLKPFVVGDYIIENGDNMEGKVDEITIFYTKLLTPDNKAILIPNGSLSNSSIINVTAMDKRRIDIEVGVAYDSDLAKVKRILTEIIINDESILKDEEFDVFVSLLGDSSITMGVRLWVKNDDYWMAKWRITENIKLEFDKAGINIPFPQLEVNLKK